MLRSSLKIAPSKPSCRRRISFSQRAREAGRARVDLRDRSRAPASRWPARPTSQSYGRASSARIAVERALVDRHLGVAVGLDEAVAGEVLAAVAPCRPAAGRASGSWPAASTTRGSRWKARSPITPLPPWSRSSTGVKLRSTPQARSSAPSTWPAAVAASVARIAPLPAPRPSSIHSSPSARIGGRCGEAVGAEALHAAALVVDADQQVGPQRLDLGGQLGELAPVAASCARTGSGRR